MIRFLSPGEVPLPDHPLLGPTFSTLLACFPPGEETAPEWWVQEGSGALLCRHNQVFYLHGTPGADGEEIARFVRLAGCAAFQATAGLAPAFSALGGSLEERRLLLGPSAPPPAPSAPLEALSAGELEAVASACFPLFAARRDNGRWLWEFSRRLRGGRAFAGGLREEGQLVCAGAITHQDRRWAVLGYIACLPPHQGRGLGSQVVTALVRRAASGSRRASLLCRRELLPFYRSLGFTETEPVTEGFFLP